jgi:SAM-dependent methyltransferase
MIALDQAALQAWRVFLSNDENRGHVARPPGGADVAAHVNACLDSAIATVGRMRADLGPGLQPRTILEIGCSTGVNCMALKRQFPLADVIGLEPEPEAVNAARATFLPLVSDGTLRFVQGVGERLPLDPESVDLILCHTVIEHVADVAQVIAEMSRVLRRDGVVHLEAPNYVYPYEPHLQIFTVPLAGKPFVRLCARLQGKRREVRFLDHLQFVTPGMLERLFRENRLAWENRALDKLHDAVNGRAQLKKHFVAAAFLRALRHVGAAGVAVTAIRALRIYPSVMYTLRRQSTG